MITTFQILFVLINIGIGKYQAYRFDVKQKRINHKLWALWYFLLLVPVYIICKNWILIGELVLFHIPVFNTSLNLSRLQKRSIFYTNPEDPEGSLIDKLWNKHYEVVFWISIVLIIIGEFFLYIY